jgi:hypothetical protein
MSRFAKGFWVGLVHSRSPRHSSRTPRAHRLACRCLARGSSPSSEGTFIHESISCRGRGRRTHPYSRCALAGSALVHPRSSGAHNRLQHRMTSRDSVYLVSWVIQVFSTGIRLGGASCASRGVCKPPAPGPALGSQPSTDASRSTRVVVLGSVQTRGFSVAHAPRCCQPAVKPGWTPFRMCD